MENENCLIRLHIRLLQDFLSSPLPVGRPRPVICVYLTRLGQKKLPETVVIDERKKVLDFFTVNFQHHSLVPSSLRVIEFWVYDWQVLERANLKQLVRIKALGAIGAKLYLHTRAVRIFPYADQGRCKRADACNHL